MGLVYRVALSICSKISRWVTYSNSSDILRAVVVYSVELLASEALKITKWCPPSEKIMVHLCILARV